MLCAQGEAELIVAMRAEQDGIDLETVGAEERSVLLVARAACARWQGDAAAGLPEARRAFDAMAEIGSTTTIFTFRELRLCAIAAGDRDALAAAVERVGALPPGFSSPILEAEVALARAQLAHGEEAVAAVPRDGPLPRGGRPVRARPVAAR